MIVGEILQFLNSLPKDIEIVLEEGEGLFHLIREQIELKRLDDGSLVLVIKA